MKAPARRVDAVAAQVNALHDEFLGAARRTLEIGIKIGGLLALKKEGLGHGAWLPWCESNLKFSDRTARNYMRLWVHRAELKSEPFANITGAYRQLGARPQHALPAPAAVVVPTETLAQARKQPLGHRLRAAWFVLGGSHERGS